MKMIETKNHYRNDYHWLGECEACGHQHWWRDGYADDYYVNRVAPGRHCPECGLNSHGQPRDGITATSAASATGAKED